MIPPFDTNFEYDKWCDRMRERDILNNYFGGYKEDGKQESDS